MPVCKICKTKNIDNTCICENCGSYLKLSVGAKWLIAGIICGAFAIIFSKTPLIILLLFAPLLIIISLVLIIKDTLKINQIRKQNNVDIKELTKKNYEELKQKHSTQLNQLAQEYKEITEENPDTDDASIIEE